MTTRTQDCIPFLGPDGGYLSEKGAQFIASQMMRILMHAGLHYHIKQLRRQHPEVDIILSSPGPTTTRCSSTTSCAIRLA